MNSENFSWTEVYSYWKHFVENYSYKSIEDSIFKQVQIQSQSNPNLNIGTGIIDVAI